MKRHASMNRIYRLVWSEVRNAWIAVSENATGRGKRTTKRKFIATALALAFAPFAQASPTGGQISAGSGVIAQAGLSTTITQNSQNLAINWQGFNIAANEAVRFNQPNASSIALNRVLGQNPSSILGNLSANGQVFVLNPNGILFGAGSQVNVGGLVATTLNLNDADFMANKFTFSNSGTSGSVINKGTLSTNTLTTDHCPLSTCSYIALLAPEVRNEGIITATLGTALLAAGNQVTINLNNGSLLSYSIDQGALNALSENKQLIQADGGAVILSAKAADSLSTAAVNNTGIIEARTVQNVSGTIKLLGDMQTGTVNVGGTLDASDGVRMNSDLQDSKGGFIETSAAHVKIADTARVTTTSIGGNAGTWLIDPVDFTIAASGGDMTGTTLSSNLGGGNVTILSSKGATGTAGDVNVNDIVNWGANILTLNAQNNININANLNGSGTASLALQYGQGALAAGNASDYFINNGSQINLSAGNYFSTKLGSNGVLNNFTVITSLGVAGSITTTDLIGINGNLNGKYALGANIDAISNVFIPIGYISSLSQTAFSGSLNGLGHTINNLTVNSSTLGLFVNTNVNSIIRDLGVLNVSMTNASGTGGGLAGGNSGLISNCYTTGVITGGALFAGGLVGLNGPLGSIINSHSSANVSNTTQGTGGLVGSNAGKISFSYATGNVTGAGTDIGGLAGTNGGTISYSYATGLVTASAATNVGGLVGINLHNINNSYATGIVNGGVNVGGLVGANGDVFAVGSGTISNSYATGKVTGGFVANMGGLVGSNYLSTVSNSFWDSSINAVGYTLYPGRAGTISGVAGMTTAQMQTQANYTTATAVNNNLNPAWDFSNTWVMYDGYTYPLLRHFMTPLIVSANNASKIYDGVSFSGGNGVTYSSQPNANLLGTFTYNGSSQGAVNAGSYLISLGGLYSNQQGYIITLVDGSLIVSPAILTVSGLTSTSRTYDGTVNVNANIFSLSGLANGETLSLTGFGTISSKNVGAYSVNWGLLTIGNATGLFSNYILTQPGSTIVTITPAPLVLTTVNVSKTYDGNTTASVVTAVSGGTLFSGDTLSGGTFAFSDKNVGIGNKTVTATGITVNDGNNGGNYSVSYANNTNSSITQLGSVAWAGGATGLWSNAANWAGGAIPDYANVVAVTIPSGITVTYDAAVVGSTTLTTLSSSSNLTMAAGSLSVTGDLNTLGYTQAGGTLNVGGTLSINSPGNVVLGNLQTLNLNVNSGGVINQNGVSANTLTVNGIATLAATGNINLSNTGNDFKNAVNASSAAAILLTDKNALTTSLNSTGASTLVAGGSLSVSGTANGGLTATTSGAGSNIGFGTSSVTGVLNASSSGVINQNGVSANSLTVSGVATLNATGNINLSNTGNDFKSSVNATSAAAILLTDMNALTTTLNSTGAATLVAGGALSLAGTANGGLTATTTGTGSNIVFNTTSVTGALNASSSGVINQNGVAANTLTVTGIANLTGVGNVNLSNATNDFKSAVNATSGAAILLTDVNTLTATLNSVGTSTLVAGGVLGISGVAGGGLTATTTGTGSTIALGTTTVTGTLTATSSGVINQNGVAGNTLKVSGNSILNGVGNVNLSNASNDFGGNVNVTSGAAILLTDINSLTTTFNSVGSATLKTGGILNLSGVAGGGLTTTTTGVGSNTVLGTTNVTGALNGVSSGGISQTPGTLLKVTGNTILSGVADVILANINNDFVGTVNATSGAALTLTDVNALSAVVNSTGLTTLTAGGILGVSGVGSGGLTTTTTGAGSTTVFNPTSVGGALNVNSSGSINQNGVAANTLTVAGTSTLKGIGDVNLSNSGNDFVGAVSATSNTNIFLTDLNALTATVNSGGLTTLNAGGVLGISGVSNGGLTATTSGVNSDVVLGTLGVTGPFNMTSSKGISQAVSTTLTSAGIATLNTVGNINLPNANNDFKNIVNATSSGTVVLTDVNSLTVALASTGASTLTAGGGLGLLSATTGGNLTMTTTGVGSYISVGPASVGGNLSANSSGVINQNGVAANTLAVAGTSTLTATGNVNLSNAGNDFGGAVSASSGVNVLLTDVNTLTATINSTGYAALNAGGVLTVSGTVNNGLTTTTTGTNSDTVFGNGNIVGRLTATSSGGISQNSRSSLTVSAGTFLTAANNITLNNAGNDFKNTVNVTTSGAVAVADSNALTVVLNNTGLTTLTAGGVLGISGTIAGGLNATTTGAGSSMVFSTTSVGGNLSANSSSVINQNGVAANSLTVAGSSALTATGNINLSNANNRFVGTVNATSGGNLMLTDLAALTAIINSVSVTLNSAGALNISGIVSGGLTTTTTGMLSTTTFGSTSVGTNLVVNSTGAVTQATPTSLTVKGAGTTVANAHVTVNNVVGALIP